MPRNVVEFTANCPVELALRYHAGKIMETRFGKRAMYSLIDGRVMFHDLTFAERINNLALEPGEAFFICCKWAGDRGDQREWDCWLSPATEKARALAEMASEEEPPDAEDLALREKLQDSIICAQLEKERAASTANSTSPVSGTDGPGPKVQPQSRPHPKPQPRPKQISIAPLPATKFGARAASWPRQVMIPPSAKMPPLKQQYSAAFEEFLIAAGRVVAHAEKALSHEGASIRFDSRDVAAIATSMFIEAGRKDYLIWTPGGMQTA